MIFRGGGGGGYRTPSHPPSVSAHVMKNISVYGTGCGGTLTRLSGQIQSPDEDNDGVFDHGVECEWTLIFENTIIELHMLRLDLKTPSFKNCNTLISSNRYSSNQLYVSIIIVRKPGMFFLVPTP